MRNMKKVLAVILMVLMLINLIGCSKTNDTSSESTDSSNIGKVGNSSQGNTASDENLTVHKNTFFSVGYNEEDGWTLAEDDIYMSEYGGSAYLRILDEDDYTDVYVKITAEEEEASSFRSTLHSNGIDLKAYAEDNCDLEDIGNLSMAVVDKGDGKYLFLNRDAVAGISYIISVSDLNDPRVENVIENISFIASETENIDPPWYWEGEPFSADAASQVVGTYTLSAQFIPMDDPMITYETFDHDIAVVGDKVYILSDEALYQYEYDGSKLTFVKEISLPGGYDMLEKGANNNIVLSSFMEPVIGYDGNEIKFSYDGPDSFTVAPDGTWGISWFSSGDSCERYVFENGALTGSDFPFAEVDIISHLNIDEKYILISGYASEDDEYYLFAYDHSGNLKFRMGGDPDGFGLGSITYATSTDNGFIGLDGNMREVVLWNTDGTWIGSVDDDDLFGTYYPWMASADVADDGSLLIIMSEKRADESADEVIVFKLSGF